MKKRLFIKIFSLSLLISLIITPLRGGYISIGDITGFYLSSIVGFLIYFVFTYYFLAKAKDKLSPAVTLFAIITGLCSLMLSVRLIFFKSTLTSDLELIIHLLAIPCGYWFYRSNVYVKIPIGIISIIGCFWLSINVYDLWIHKLSYGTFTGKIEITIAPDFQFVSESGDTLSLADFSEKYVVVDFWFTRCGVCFEKFPKVQSLYDKYKDNSSVAVFSINARLENESDNVAFETIKNEDYSFPTYRLDMGNPVLYQLGVNGYPTVLIFDRESKLVFRGSIEQAKNYIEKIIQL